MTHSFKVHQFHLVWSTKNRRNLIEKSFQKRLYDYMGCIIKEHKGHLLEIGGIANHVHLLISLSNLNNYSDQWTYALACYRPIFNYTAIAGTAGTGRVVAINGTYRAGTPLSSAGTPINTLVQGGSGGGGNNYTGSTSSYDNFTACPVGVIITSRSVNPEAMQTESQDLPLMKKVAIYPNPATNSIDVQFTPAQTGLSKIVIFNINGKKVREINNGVWEKDIMYQKRVNVSDLPGGIYLVQVINKGNITTEKIVIRR